ncbi:hypothetical protein AVEN_87014-1 [Araneus ventricosus]|uniref:Uncharacterized protein n=1 Tax=Araneus ventricosus TaxID=182803 RepID=A0A4Y2MUW0_ARAVE|nr:hypothetical protein AVEN_87014-1 [Araneus ventricosus]
MILAIKEYDEESAKEWLNTIINERKEREENERRNEEIQMEERRRKEEQDGAERRHQEEIAERRQQKEIELRKQEYEERMRMEVTRGGRERMKWNLSCKKYALGQKVGL